MSKIWDDNFHFFFNLHIYIEITHLRKPKTRSLRIFRKVFGVFQRNFNGSKIVLSSSRGQGNFQDLRLRGQGLQNVSSRTSSWPRTSSRTPPLANTLVLDAMYDKFTNIIKPTVNEHAPIKIASWKRQKLLERPWITRGPLVSIKRKQKMYKTHFFIWRWKLNFTISNLCKQTK